MRRTIVLSLVAIGCGLVASIGVSPYIAGISNGEVVDTEQILVAANDINIGEKLGAQNVQLQEWPRDRIPEGAIRGLEGFEDRRPRQRLYAGEPIVPAKLMRETHTEWIGPPNGFRVVSVRVRIESLEPELLVSGDRVKLAVEVPGAGLKTVLHEVTVFSVDGETQRDADAEERAGNVRRVSLLVNPRQCEDVKSASELGEFRLQPCVSMTDAEL